MANKIETLFDSLAKKVSWSAGVAFNRTNPLPLDKFSVFSSKAAAEEYINRVEGNICYPGQVLAVAEIGSSKLFVTQVKEDDTYELIEIGSIKNALVYKGVADNKPTADSTIITVNGEDIVASAINIGWIYVFEGIEYISNGSKWDEVGPNIDTSVFLTITNAAQIYLSQESAKATYAPISVVGNGDGSDIGGEQSDYANLTLTQRINKLKQALENNYYTKSQVYTKEETTNAINTAIAGISVSINWEDISTEITN